MCFLLHHPTLKARRRGELQLLLSHQSNSETLSAVFVALSNALLSPAALVYRDSQCQSLWGFRLLPFSEMVASELLNHALSVLFSPTLLQSLHRFHGLAFSSNIFCELWAFFFYYCIMSSKLNLPQAESRSRKAAWCMPALQIYNYYLLVVLGCAAIGYVFSRFWLSSTSTHYLQAAGGCLPHLKVSVWMPSTHTHTHPKHHYPWHTQPTACPCPLVTQPLPPPHSVP